MKAIYTNWQFDSTTGHKMIPVFLGLWISSVWNKHRVAAQIRRPNYYTSKRSDPNKIKTNQWRLSIGTKEDTREEINKIIKTKA